MSAKPIKAVGFVTEYMNNERIIKLNSDENGVSVSETGVSFLRKAFASAHFNVLLGSAFSAKTVPTLGERECWFQAVDNRLIENPGDPNLKTVRALLRAEYFNKVMNPLRDKEPKKEQIDFLLAVTRIVSTRGANTLPRRLNLFTTNYDSFIELGLEKLGIAFNDGFVGRVAPVYDLSCFSRLMCEQSLFMEYASLVTTVNILKLHGSLTWSKNCDNVITYSKLEDNLDACCSAAGIEAFTHVDDVANLIAKPYDDAGLDSFRQLVTSLSNEELNAIGGFASAYASRLCIVNPAKKKFEETVLEQVYYDLLRMYANELDRNNTFLLVFGFSFADEHIQELTRRALRSNPKLIVLISCHSTEDVEKYDAMFSTANNVYYLVPEEGNEIDLDTLTEVLTCVTK